MNIGNYETENFDLSTIASESFAILAAHTDAIDDVEIAAEYVDKALGILKDATEAQTATDADLDLFDEYISEAEIILDSLEELEKHYYLRDIIETQLMNWYTIDEDEINDIINQSIADEDIDDDYDEHNMDYSHIKELEF